MSVGVVFCPISGTAILRVTERSINQSCQGGWVEVAATKQAFDTQEPDTTIAKWTFLVDK